VTDSWRTRINVTLSGVRKEAWAYFLLGMFAYAGVGLGCYFTIKNSSLVGVAIMGFFQFMVIFFATLKIYPCIRGGFLVGLEQTYETIPVFDRMSESINRLDKLLEKIEKRDLDKAERAFNRVADSIEDGLVERLESHLKAIRGRVERDTEPVPTRKRETVEG
jgi:hypothetical protein